MSINVSFESRMLFSRLGLSSQVLKKDGTFSRSVPPAEVGAEAGLDPPTSYPFDAKVGCSKPTKFRRMSTHRNPSRDALCSGATLFDKKLVGGPLSPLRGV